LAKIKKSRKRIKNWIIIITAWTFVLAISLSLLSETLIIRANLILSIMILVVIIAIGVLADMAGIAVTACPQVPLVSKASNKIKGAKEAMNLIKNADRVSNFFNDVVGDITGIISGAVGAAIVFRVLTTYPGIEKIFLSVAITGFIASLTVGGKAMGKSIAIKNSVAIVLKLGFFVHLFTRKQRINKKNR
jgi:CBS domain containing-hemolysin-like protein